MIGDSKLRSILNTILMILLFLEFVKLVELLVVYTIKGRLAIIAPLVGIFCLMGIIYRKNFYLLHFMCLVNFVLIFAFDVVNQHFAFMTSLLVIFSLDAVLQRMKFSKSDVDRTTSILLIAQLSILYLFAAIWKFNDDYFTGMQMLEHIRSFLIFPDLTNPNPVIYRGLSILAFTIEVVLAFQLLFRGKYLSLIQSLGFFFHVSIVLLIGEDLRNSFQLGVFAIACLSIYPLFDVRNWQDRKLDTYWDAGCSFCAKSVAIFEKLDRNVNFNFVSNLKIEKMENLPFEKNLVNDTIIVYDEMTGRYWTKSKAILLIISNNHFLWFLKPLIFLPLIFKLSDRFYDHVARKRTCHI